MCPSRRHLGFGTIAAVALAALLLTGVALARLGAAPAPSSAASRLAAGGYHTCAVTGAGAVKCWGSNFYGQLGDDQHCGGAAPLPPDCATPVGVAGLSSGVKAVVAGEYHSCALTGTGAVKCWGYNAYGQLGDGTTTDRHVPVDVAGLGNGVVALAASGYHTCAVTGTGGAKCWGRNEEGQLGDGTRTNRSGPVDVSGLSSGTLALAAGFDHTCALSAAGAVSCWGANQRGELGDDHACGDWCLTPVGVSGLGSGVTRISGAAGHTCALGSAGGLRCWGQNEVGELGDGTTVDRHVPVDVAGLASGVAAVAVGGFHACALTAGGAARCWGWNHFGQLGDGTTSDSHIAVDVHGLTGGVAALVAGDRHTCALLSNGALECWGRNGFAELGNGTHDDSSVPVQVTGFGPIPVKPSCRVPAVVGQTLAKAKASIRKRSCRVGKVTAVRSKPRLKGRVLAQTPKPGKTLQAGAKVNLRVGRGR